MKERKYKEETKEKTEERNPRGKKRKMAHTARRADPRKKKRENSAKNGAHGATRADPVKTRKQPTRGSVISCETVTPDFP
jgi:hypothetical protein